MLHLGAAEAEGSFVGGPVEGQPLVVVTWEAYVDALQDGPTGWDQVCSSVTPEALVDLMGAFAPWGHRATAC